MKAYWGYGAFLPLQREAMASILRKRDSLVVLPTGGGKSLCFQVPALAMPGMAVVVSPLISLMKDQVDALVQCGVAAACLNSSLPPEERRAIMSTARAGRLKILYVAPERLVQDAFIGFLRNTDLSFVAVDEAHCISMWGHDFRPEYRELRILKEVFPGKAVHCYTATATEHVRTDIVRQLGLDSPEVLVGSFDRPNLIYRVARRHAGRSKIQQLREVIDRHRGESGIIYCITRKDVELLSGQLSQLGYRSLPYHAGMEAVERKNSQEAFIREESDIIVATVAFGMGIDKSNVRYVIHAGMPKSLEHYQQESGRAGRDGLEAECCLFYSLQDYTIWQRILGKPTEGATATASAKASGSAEAATMEPLASAGRSAEATTAG
ncbi:MAG: ATP-dependent DNA helicase RecQ, partial [Candidatus Eisenbacteria sp.]|nr:ATP-dependent DNA helicase RecQ [Candidatus Eisenbacteria bacterium]